MSERASDVPVLVLVGVSGAGKTAAGRIAAQVLGARFVDADDLVERAAGRSVHRLALEDPQALSRRQRDAGLAALAPGGRGAGAVVALPASCPALPGVGEALERARGAGSVVIELVAGASDVVRREDLGGPHSMALGAPRAMLARMIRELRAVYAPLVDGCVDTHDKAPAEVAQEAVRAVRQGPQSRMTKVRE